MNSATQSEHAVHGGHYLSLALRDDLYVLLSSMLVRPPTGDLIQQLTDLRWDCEISPALSAALEALRTAAGCCSPETAEHEFEDLFIGLGRGEIVPYASWYANKLLMGAPLVRLRGDLAKLQIRRQAMVCEPEDHAAALCETMALIIRSPKIAPAQRADFFNRHMHPWMLQFFRDLQQAPSARFYRAVGSLGEHFMRMEKQHLQA
ncbi:MAG: molecular chaperone TorD family protein [Desulfobacterales bacterium]